MSYISFSPKFDSYINQNLLSLLVGMVGLGIAERYELFYLGVLSGILSTFMVLSVLFTMLAYTVNYVKKRFCSKAIQNDEYNPTGIMVKGNIHIDLDKLSKKNENSI